MTTEQVYTMAGKGKGKGKGKGAVPQWGVGEVLISQISAVEPVGG